MARWEDYWPEFEGMIRHRLIQGHIQYGDGSFDRDPVDLTHELQQEALDIVGWGFILWVRLRELEERMAK